MAPISAQAADWVQVRTPHFTIYGRKSDRGLSELATRLEIMRKMLGTVTGVETDNGVGERPLLVYVVSNMEVANGAGTKAAAGLYATDKRNGYAMVTRGKAANKFDLGQEGILFHEYAHHHMLAGSSAAYPAWYIEGFAEFFSTPEFKDGGHVTFGRPPLYRAPQLLSREIYPLGRLLRQPPRGLSLAEGDRYYGAAWLLTHYLYLTPARRDEFNTYLVDLASPGGARDIATYFKGGEEALEKELKAYLHSRLKAYGMTIALDPELAPKTEDLPPAENALLLHELRFKRPMDAAEAEMLAREVQQIAARYPDSSYAQGFLGEVLADMGEWQPALAAVDAAIRIDPGNARAHAARAEILWKRKPANNAAIPYKEVNAAIVAANRADLNDPYPLFLYHAVKREQGPVSEVAMDGLRKAYLQLPQYEKYRWVYANALADRKEYQRAINVITPLANDPHGGRGVAAAQKRREQFVAMRDGKPLMPGMPEIEVQAPPSASPPQ